MFAFSPGRKTAGGTGSPQPQRRFCCKMPRNCEISTSRVCLKRSPAPAAEGGPAVGRSAATVAPRTPGSKQLGDCCACAWCTGDSCLTRPRSGLIAGGFGGDPMFRAGSAPEDSTRACSALLGSGSGKAGSSSRWAPLRLKGGSGARSLSLEASLAQACGACSACATCGTCGACDDCCACGACATCGSCRGCGGGSCRWAVTCASSLGTRCRATCFAGKSGRQQLRSSSNSGVSETPDGLLGG